MGVLVKTFRFPFSVAPGIGRVQSLPARAGGSRRPNGGGPRSLALISALRIDGVVDLLPLLETVELAICHRRVVEENVAAIAP